MSNSDSRKRAATLRHSQIRAKAPPLAGIDGYGPRFVADVMLGRLAKWLRIAGFDVLYSNRFTDDELVELSRTEGRILLSRDTRLLVRKVVRQFVFLESDNIRDQIKQVFVIAGVRNLPRILTRCLSCNDPLNEVTRESVRNRVPPYVFETQTRFKSCPKCHKIYWAGTHRQSVVRTLEALITGA
ncbi:MAG TPA: Mut7-C RNAse domain-containing protein [Acidobacteriota bacterium]|nr:Mut7-C RNAse domain-containing protein [Acidobacteriota bacterium]